MSKATSQILPFDPAWLGDEGFFTNYPYPYLPKGVKSYSGTYELEAEDGSRYACTFEIHANRIVQNLANSYHALVFPDKVKVIHDSTVTGRTEVASYKRMRDVETGEVELILTKATRTQTYRPTDNVMPTTAFKWVEVFGSQFERQCVELLIPEDGNRMLLEASGSQLPYTLRMNPNRSAKPAWCMAPAPVEWDAFLKRFRAQVRAWRVTIGEYFSQAQLSHVQAMRHGEPSPVSPALQAEFERHAAGFPVGEPIFSRVPPVSAEVNGLMRDVRRRYGNGGPLISLTPVAQPMRPYHLIKDRPLYAEIETQMQEFWKEFYVMVQAFRQPYGALGAPFMVPRYEEPVQD